MNQQPIKRRNPFETPKVEERVQEPVIVEETIQEVEEEPVYVEPKPVYMEPKPVVTHQPRQQPVQKPVRASNKQQYYVPEDANREKYTSTMDITLRRQIKIACATRGIMFAKFVEDACREKLAREGVR